MEANKSEFSFLDYRINKCNFSIAKEDIEVKVHFDVDVKGDINKEKNIFKLFMNLDIHGEDKLSILLESEATFSYKGDDRQKLCNFMGVNAPAVLYPYLRSYVTMITVNAGLQPLVLPTLNLTEIGRKMAKELIEQL